MKWFSEEYHDLNYCALKFIIHYYIYFYSFTKTINFSPLDRTNQDIEPSSSNEEKKKLCKEWKSWMSNLRISIYYVQSNVLFLGVIWQGASSRTFQVLCQPLFAWALEKLGKESGKGGKLWLWDKFTLLYDQTNYKTDTRQDTCVYNLIVVYLQPSAYL